MMFPLTVQCGLGGDPKNCSATPRCQLDVYYDATIDLPWLHDDQIRDNLMEGMHSGLFLQDPEYQVRSTNQYYRQRPGPDGIPQPGPLASPVVFRSGDQNITGTVAHFDREYMPGVGLISWFDPAGSGGSRTDLPRQHWRPATCHALSRIVDATRPPDLAGAQG